MKLCIAGTNTRKNMFDGKLRDLRFVLESYYYIKPWQAEQIPQIEHFMLDSGAFTFLNGANNVDIDSYVDGYISFINKHDINHFFELDIDSVVGYGEVKNIRRKIERKTKKRCIPVWHKSRGLKEFQDLCKKYDYVAIGGIVTREIKPQEYFLLNAFCDLANSYECKVHGLGFTPNNLHKYKFYSVDSTSWLSGGRFGRLYDFSDGTIKSTKSKKRIHYLEYDKHNIDQFLLYQKYLSAQSQ